MAPERPFRRRARGTAAGPRRVHRHHEAPAGKLAQAARHPGHAVRRTVPHTLPLTPAAGRACTEGRIERRPVGELRRRGHAGRCERVVWVQPVGSECRTGRALRIALAFGPEARAERRRNAGKRASGDGGNRVLQSIRFRGIRGYAGRKALAQLARAVGGGHSHRGEPFDQRRQREVAAGLGEAYRIAGNRRRIHQGRSTEGPVHVHQHMFTAGNQVYIRQGGGYRRGHILDNHHECLIGAAFGVGGRNGNHGRSVGDGLDCHRCAADGNVGEFIGRGGHREVECRSRESLRNIDRNSIVADEKVDVRQLAHRHGRYVSRGDIDGLLCAAFRVRRRHGGWSPTRLHALEWTASCR